MNQIKASLRQWSNCPGTPILRRHRKLFKRRKIRKPLGLPTKMIFRRTSHTKECLIRKVIWILSKSMLSHSRCLILIWRTLRNCMISYLKWKRTWNRRKIHQNHPPRRQMIVNNRQVFWNLLNKSFKRRTKSQPLYIKTLRNKNISLSKLYNQTRINWQQSCPKHLQFNRQSKKSR